MKRHIFMATAAIIALAMTACSADMGTADTTEENTVSVTESLAEDTTATTSEAEAESETTEETTSAEENVSVADEQVTNWSSWVDAFTNIIVDGIADEESDIGEEYLIPVSEEEKDVYIASYASHFVLCDINLDGVPELLACVISNMGRMSCTPIDVEGNVYEDFISNTEFSAVGIDNKVYAWSYNGVGSVGYTCLNEDRKKLVIFGFGGDIMSVELSPADTDEGYITYKDLTDTDVANIFIEQFGSDIRDAFNGEQNNLPFVEGCLIVPDTENYTADDIYACLDSSMAQYVELIG